MRATDKAFFRVGDAARVPVSDLQEDSRKEPPTPRRGTDYWWFALTESYKVESSPDEPGRVGGLSPAHRLAISQGMRASPHVADSQRRRRQREARLNGSGARPSLPSLSPEAEDFAENGSPQ